MLNEEPTRLSWISGWQHDRYFLEDQGCCSLNLHSGSRATAPYFPSFIRNGVFLHAEKHRKKNPMHGKWRQMKESLQICTSGLNQLVSVDAALMMAISFLRKKTRQASNLPHSPVWLDVYLTPQSRSQISSNPIIKKDTRTLVFRKKRTFLSLLFLFLKRPGFDLSMLLRNTLKEKMLI